MRKLIVTTALTCVILIGLITGSSFPAISPGKVETPKERIAVKDMTREDMIAELKTDLADNEELFDMMPDIKAEKDDSGVNYFTINGTRVEGLSDETLKNVFTRVRQAVIRIRTDRIQQQLDMVRQAERAQRVIAPLRPPQIPSAVRSAPPSQPQSAPKPPSLPPAPPRR